MVPCSRVAAVVTSPCHLLLLPLPPPAIDTCVYSPCWQVRRVITNPTVKHNFSQLLARAEGDKKQVGAEWLIAFWGTLLPIVKPQIALGLLHSCVRLQATYMPMHGMNGTTHIERSERQ